MLQSAWTRHSRSTPSLKVLAFQLEPLVSKRGLAKSDGLSSPPPLFQKQGHPHHRTPHFAPSLPFHRPHVLKLGAKKLKKVDWVTKLDDEWLYDKPFLASFRTAVSSMQAWKDFSAR